VSAPINLQTREQLDLIKENAGLLQIIEENEQIINSDSAAQSLKVAATGRVRDARTALGRNRQTIISLGFQGNERDLERSEMEFRETGQVSISAESNLGRTDGGFEETETLEGEDAAAFLLNRSQGVLATLNEKIIENFLEETNVRQENVIQLTAPDISLLVNLITRRPNLLPFFRIRTPYLSLVVPKIRLFKKVFEKRGNEYVKREGGDLEFKFRSFTSNTKIEEITNSGFGRGDGVGIKNVNWSYEGTNPETVTSFINFDISLFFQNLSDLIGNRITSADQALLDRDNVDLIQLIGAGIGFEGSDDTSPFRFEIEAQLGWELDNSINEDLASDQSVQAIREIIKDTSVTLRLSLKEHSINFNDDGTLTLDLSYFSAIDEVFSDEKLNILAVGLRGIDLITEAKEEDREALSSPREVPSAGRGANVNEDPCLPEASRRSQNGDSDDEDRPPTRAQQAIRAALIAQGQNESIIQNYNTLFSKILSNNKIYTLEIDAERIISQVGLEVGKANVFTRRSEQSQRILNTTSVLARAFTEEELSNLRGNSIQVNRVNSFELELINEQEQAQIRQEAVEMEDAEASNSIDVDDVTTRLHNEIVSRYQASANGRLKIEFIRLGDIIDNVIQSLKESENSPLAQRKDDFEFITGLFVYVDPETGDRKGYNYSDMLISIDAFRMFFVEKIIRPLKVKYNLTNFIVDLANKFSYVNSIRLSAEETFVASEGRPAFSVFQGPDIGLSEAARRISNRQSFLEGTAGLNLSSALESVSDTRQGVVEGELSGILSETVSNSSENGLKFYFILRSNNEIISRKGDETEDIQNGIYHLKLGSDKGILKSINFTRDEIRGRREGRIVRAGALNVNALREKYDASITIFGAPFIFPGMYIYIDPKMIGMGSGTGANDVSAARVLGLGGYYFVNKVSNSINSEGNFETQLEASFNSFGPPDCRLKDIQIFSPQLDAVSDINTTEQVSGVTVDEEEVTLREAVESSPAGDYVEVVQVPGVDPVVVPRLGSTRNF